MAGRKTDEWLKRTARDLLSKDERAGASVPNIASRSVFEPKIDLFEDPKQFLIKVEIPGVRLEDLRVVYLPDVHAVVVQGVRKEENVADSLPVSAHQLEILYGEFARVIELPDSPIEPDRMKIAYRLGFLNIFVPKARMRVTHTRITIRRV